MKTNQRTNLQTTIVNFIRGKQLFLVVIEGLSRLNHKFSLLSVHRDRLNPETSLFEDAIVRTQAIYKTCEGFPKSVPARGTGSKVTVRTAATVPLTDGQTPAGDQLSVTDFQAQIQWYGKQKWSKAA